MWVGEKMQRAASGQWGHCSCARTWMVGDLRSPLLKVLPSALYLGEFASLYKIWVTFRRTGGGGDTLRKQWSGQGQRKRKAGPKAPLEVSLLVYTFLLKLLLQLRDHR